MKRNFSVICCLIISFLTSNCGTGQSFEPTPMPSPTTRIAPTTTIALTPLPLPSPTTTADIIAVTVAPSPSPTSLPLAVTSFVVSPTTLSPGEVMTFTWTSQGEAVSVSIQERLELSDGRSIVIRDWENLPPNGELHVTTSTDDHDTYTFNLVVYDEFLQMAWNTNPVTLRFICPYVYFFVPAPDACPDSPAQSQSIVEQSFENGRAIWIQNGEHGTAWFYILFADGTAIKVFDELWLEAAEDSKAKTQLGQAISPKQSVTIQYQTDSRPYLLPTTDAGPIYRPELMYLNLADGKVIKIILDRDYGMGGEWYSIEP